MSATSVVAPSGTRFFLSTSRWCHFSPFAAVLEGRAQAVLAALDARTKAKAALSSVSVEVEEWKDGVNRLRLSTYAELLKVAAEKKYPRSFADAFFLSESRTTLDEEPVDPPAPVEPVEPVA